MGGLLAKEYYTLRRYFKQYIILFIFFGVLSIYIMESVIYFQAMVTMSMSMLVFTGMSFDMAAGWDKFVLTMPVSRKDVVLSKYVCCLIYALASLLVTTVFGVLLGAIHPMRDNDLYLLLGTALVLFCIICVIYAVLLPMIFKFGVERTRILMMAVIFIPVFAIVAGIQYLPETVIAFMVQNVNLMVALAVALSILLYIGSYFMSLGIFSKKEF
ncbi:MAG: ABC-2 transporter permease [Frisingicoccus sp.]